MQENNTEGEDKLESEGVLNSNISTPTQVVDNSKNASISALDNPIEYIPGIDVNIAYLPIGPTQDQINQLVSSGRLEENQIYVGDEACKEAEINNSTPQVFGYVIKDDEELEMIIRDKELVENIKIEMTESGEYPTIYLMNDQARVEYTQHLGGRIPSLEELKNIWKSIPGNSNIEKAIHAGVPFAGIFDSQMFNQYFCNKGTNVVLGSTHSQKLGYKKYGGPLVCSGIDLNTKDYYDGFDRDRSGETDIKDAQGVSTFVIFDDEPSTKHHDGVDRL